MSYKLKKKWYTTKIKKMTITQDDTFTKSKKQHQTQTSLIQTEETITDHMVETEITTKLDRVLQQQGQKKTVTSTKFYTQFQMWYDTDFDTKHQTQTLKEIRKKKTTRHTMLKCSSMFQTGLKQVLQTTRVDKRTYKKFTELQTMWHTWLKKKMFEQTIETLTESTL